MKAISIFLRKSPNQEKGAALVEFALIVPLLLLLLMGIIELGALFWVNMTMQHAVREGSRYAITGRVDLDPNPNPGDRVRPAAVEEKIRLSSLGLYDSVALPPIKVTAPDGTGLSGFGAAGETVVIELDCSWPLLTPLVRPFFDDGTYDFTVSSTMRNENF